MSVTAVVEAHQAYGEDSGYTGNAQLHLFDICVLVHAHTHMHKRNTHTDTHVLIYTQVQAHMHSKEGMGSLS